MALTTEQQMQINGALQPGIQLALPQTYEKVTKKQHQVQGIQYDPQKLQALKSALGIARPTMSKWEAVANALAQTPQPRSFTGGFGEEIINPWGEALSNFARGFGSAYSAQKADEREKAEQAREDAIKAAQLDYEASKKTVSDAVADDYIKLNQSNNQTEQQQAMEQLDMLEKQLEDIGTRYDDDFKNIDDMEKHLTKADTASVGALWGVGRTSKEKQAERDLGAWKSSMQNVLVNANRKAGSGTMSDADAARYEQNISTAKDLPEARAILRSFKARMSASPVAQPQINTQPITQTKAKMSIDDIWNMLDK